MQDARDDAPDSRTIEAKLDAGQRETLARFVDLVRERNRTLNLVSAGDVEKLWSRHVADSLLGTAAADLAGGRVADIGSGAGFPGIPLAVAFPTATFVLIERTRKRAAFIRQAIRQLGIANASEEWASAEDVGAQEPGAFDFVTVRAVSGTADAVELAAPLLAPGGEILLWQSEGQRAEEALPPGWTERWVSAGSPEQAGRGIRALARMG